VRIDEIPITPEKVLRALRDKERGRPARFGPVSVPRFPWPEPMVIPTPSDGGDGRAVSGEPERKSSEVERRGGGQ
jgi:hypothetical protein